MGDSLWVYKRYGTEVFCLRGKMAGGLGAHCKSKAENYAGDRKKLHGPSCAPIETHDGEREGRASGGFSRVGAASVLLVV